MLFLFLSAFVWAQKKVGVREVVIDSAVKDIVWIGASQKIILILTNSGRLYRSENNGVAWFDLSSKLGGDDDVRGVDAMVTSIVVHPTVYSVVLAVGAYKDHFLSDDSGRSWRKLKQKATIQRFSFHPTRPSWAAVSSWTDACFVTDKAKSNGPCNHMLFITKDFGRTFSIVSSYLIQFAWGTQIHNQQDRLYFTHHRTKMGDQPKLVTWTHDADLVYTDDGGQSIERVIFKGNKFGVIDAFIFCAKLKDSDTQTVELLVSNDGGRIFRPAKLPEALSEHSYTVLDTSEDAVILHVDHGHEGLISVGNVYISEKTGSRYTLSLPNNVRGQHGDCEFDKIQGLYGIYLANYVVDDDGSATQTLDEANNAEAGDASETEIRKSKTRKGKAETKIRSVITFDKGGVWSYLRSPKVDSLGRAIDCPDDSCWLHLHGTSLFSDFAPFYSQRNAIGVIMGTGNVGAYLRFESDQTNTYLSRDGGLTWIEAHKGAFIYEYGDHGGLLVMANDVQATNMIVFSWNEGSTWYDFDFAQQKLNVDNVVTFPNNTSTQFLLYGTRESTGVVYFLDFNSLDQRACTGVYAASSVSSDYEQWSPSADHSNDKCLLGRHVTFSRRKPTAECWNGELFERPITEKFCKCTISNYECELGFLREVGSQTCILQNADIAAPDECTPGLVMWIHAYRKVPGDGCQDGWVPTKDDFRCPGMSNSMRTILNLAVVIVIILLVLHCRKYSVDIYVGVVNALNWGRDLLPLGGTGFMEFHGVKYGRIDEDGPETALESVGTRVDAEFIEEPSEDDATRLMNYNNENILAEERKMRHEEVRRIDTAAEHVPALPKPDGMELDIL
eukprot:GEMP01006971.1.p1 GENE.GEMP01006971.1~~GEMP01006971.1.p1  ORF type:complete len:841 (+),score=152.98 GEMP01006971.1:153-2675(+)